MFGGDGMHAVGLLAYITSQSSWSHSHSSPIQHIWGQESISDNSIDMISNDDFMSQKWTSQWYHATKAISAVRQSIVLAWCP